MNAAIPFDHNDISSRSEESRVVLEMGERNEYIRQHQQEAFTKAFIRTLKGEAEGALSTYLFYDITNSDSRSLANLEYDASTILSGGNAWDRHIAETIEVKNPEEKTVLGSDKSVIKFALNHGMTEQLPGAIKFVTYGAGDEIAFSQNEGQIIHALQSADHQIKHFCAVDILERYAIEAVVAARSKYKIGSYSAVLGDFISNGRLAIKETSGHPIITIFGNTFENTPHYNDGIDLETRAAVAWAKMNLQHNYKGHMVIKTFDGNQTAAEQVEKYAPTRNFEAFILSAFARAAQTGVITNENYDVFENWRLKTQFNEVTKSIELLAECKKDHSVKSPYLPEGKMEFHAATDETPADSRIITLSHKWTFETHKRIAERAGYKVVEYKEPGNSNILMLATAIRDPDEDLRKLAFN